jgi:hypothetical protein
MKQLLLAGIAALSVLASAASIAAEVEPPAPSEAPASAAPPPSGLVPAPPPLGWVYGPYTQCADAPRCSTGVVTVQADGLNIRTVPNGPPVMALVNGTTFIPVQRQGDWFLIAPACDLTPTWVWSWTAPVQLFRCWVYF